MTSSSESRLQRALQSLAGLAIGDAVGRALVNAGELTPAFGPPPWEYTDDTEMAIAIVERLAAGTGIDQDALAMSFAERFSSRPARGYGAVAHWILARIAEGHPWRDISYTPYSGSGSKGNGAAMRVGPLGAYFADDVEQAAREASLSAEVTHGHPQGRAGAIAIALGAAIAVCKPGASVLDLRDIAAQVPDSELRVAIDRASGLTGVQAREAASVLGTGKQLMALDTVPFALWCAFSHLDDFGAALSTAIAGFDAPESDADTICAIVGGIAALSCSDGTIPAQWSHSAEPLPTKVVELARAQSH